MKTPRELLPELYETVRMAHDYAKMEHGHGFESHVNRVAAVAGKCAEPKWRKMAVAAGLCHNVDRLLAVEFKLPHRKEVPREEVSGTVRMWLDATTNFVAIDKDIIVQAVLDHERPNNLGDHPVQIALQDGDRVVNAALDVIIRSGQFRHELPVIDMNLLLDDTRGKYNGRMTVIADLLDCLDWDAPGGKFGCRTKVGQRMIKPRVAELRRFLLKYIDQLKQEGVVEKGRFS